MDAKKMQQMKDVFKNAKEIGADVGRPYVECTQTGQMIIDGWFDSAYLYVELEKIFKD